MNVSFNFTEMIFIYFKNVDIFRIDTNQYLLFIVACHRIMPKTLMPVAFSAVHKQQQQRVIFMEIRNFLKEFTKSESNL